MTTEPEAWAQVPASVRAELDQVLAEARVAAQRVAAAAAADLDRHGDAARIAAVLTVSFRRADVNKLRQLAIGLAVELAEAKRAAR